jgi:hypothetical protein
MIVRTEAIAQADSLSLDCWVQLSLPQVALCWLRVDCFDFRGKLVFVVCGAIEFMDTSMPKAFQQSLKNFCISRL